MKKILLQLSRLMSVRILAIALPFLHLALTMVRGIVPFVLLTAPWVAASWSGLLEAKRSRLPALAINSPREPVTTVAASSPRRKPPPFSAAFMSRAKRSGR